MHVSPLRALQIVARILITSVLVLVLAAAAMPVHSEPDCHARYVKWDAGGTVHDGSSWATAYTTLSQALAAANSGDWIMVARGTYTPDPAQGRASTFALKYNVRVYGGFAGTETDYTQSNWLANPTILSGDIGVKGDTSDNSYHVVTANSLGTTEFKGFIITGGNANGDGDNGNGGGMFLSGAASGLTNLEFLRNHASLGGGLYLDSGSDTVLDQAFFYGNTATDGGGLYANGAKVSLANGIFSGNVAVNAGGGLFQNTGYVLTKNLTFSGNVAKNGGAVMHIPASPKPMLDNAVIWGNVATNGPSVWDGNSGSNPLTASYSIIEGGYVGTGILDQNPLFVRAPDRGPDGTWGTADDDYGDLHLRMLSPGIDSGSDLGAPTIDIVDDPRPTDGNDDGVPRTDMGAYENDPLPNRLFLPVVTR